MTKKEEVRDYGHIPGANQDVSNPNAMNRPFAWPIKMRSSMAKYDQVRGDIAAGDFALREIGVNKMICQYVSLG